ncbi:galactoside alpha-(1,2)-fucosyltransferase 2-like [Mya arenaria]|uniref:galactoside alpha-(1,2)-fucosyltransferase 2-like n=1 Tax=Mya arenaria TaxID=6604 RepID=UPI0022E54BB6|nr:galactoside alpha-(1,2)-fucosyltransferase 2-like [Mya arenaria]
MGNFSEFIKGWFIVILVVSFTANGILLIGIFAYSGNNSGDLDLETRDMIIMGKGSFNFEPPKNVKEQHENRRRDPRKKKITSEANVDDFDKKLAERALNRFGDVHGKNGAKYKHRDVYETGVENSDDNFNAYVKNLPDHNNIQKENAMDVTVPVKVDNNKIISNGHEQPEAKIVKLYKSGRKEKKKNAHKDRGDFHQHPKRVSDIDEHKKENVAHADHIRRNPVFITDKRTYNDSRMDKKALKDVQNMNLPNKSDMDKTENIVTPVNTELFITMEPKGQLCNQLFQVASLIGIAKLHNYTAFLPMYGFNVNEAFLLPRNFYRNMSLATFKRVSMKDPQYPNVETTKYKYPEALDKRANWILDGYFQSYKYFWNARQELRDMFKLKKRHIKQASLFVGQVSKEHKKVGVHVRRGDFLSMAQKRLGRVTATPQYIEAAMNYYMIKFGGKVTFFVISDDIEWCKDNIMKKNVIYSEFREPGQDLAIMAQCDHSIITVGTFSWWAGWLTGGIVVYYDGYPKRGSELNDVFVKEDYYPKEWIGMIS